MRSPFDEQLLLGQASIGEMEFDPHSRDDTPRLLLGLQALWRDTEARDRVLGMLAEAHAADARPGTGRPGMNFWRIVVLGVMKQGLDCDFDQLTDLANHHDQIRDMLGHSQERGLDGQRYSYRTIHDNVSLLTGELLGRINEVIVRLGHGEAGHPEGGTLRCRADSYVVETDVEHPTDVRLLGDALRSLIRRTETLAGRHGVGGWRQHAHLANKAKRALSRVVRMRRHNREFPAAVGAYLAVAAQIRAKAEATLAAVAERDERGKDARRLAQARRFLGWAALLAGQIERRLLRGEDIPHGEKVFSVFEPHTRWNAKGKAGRKVELGVPVCVVEDQHQLIVGHRIMWEGGDLAAILPLLRDCQAAFPGLRGLSTDRGYWSPEVYRAAAALLDLAAIPKKGRRTAEEEERERAPEFAEARRRHPGIESAINMLEQHGMARILASGPEGFARMVGLSVIAANLIRIGRMRQARAARERLARERTRRAQRLRLAA